MQSSEGETINKQNIAINKQTKTSILKVKPWCKIVV